MRILVITSEITFVPDNYQSVILGLAENPEIYGLMVVKNRSFKLLQQALLSMYRKTAPALSWQLVKNFFSATNWKRFRHYREKDKKVFFVNELNSPSTLEIIRKAGIDLIVCLRTQEVPNPRILKASRLGALRIHYGLLPEQKGLMCDFWAHSQNGKTGITLHQLTPLVDDGAIIRRLEIPLSATGYLEYLERSTILELAILLNFLKELRETGTWTSANRHLSIPYKYNQNPTPVDFRKFQELGLLI